MDQFVSINQHQILNLIVITREKEMIALKNIEKMLWKKRKMKIPNKNYTYFY